VVSEVVIAITDPFDGATTITVGDALAQGRFSAVADNFPAYAEKYVTDPHHLYTSDTEILIYFPSGTPTQGTGEVIVYLA